MPEQETVSQPSSSVSTQPIGLWMTLCRWLWRKLLYVWGTLIVGILISTFANFNTTTTDTPITKLYIVYLAQTFPFPVFSIFGVLVFLTLLSWIGSRERSPMPSRFLSQQTRTHMLGRLLVRYNQMHTQLLQGVAHHIEVGLSSKPGAVHNVANLSMHLSDHTEHLLPPHCSIVNVYEQAHHELLILGEPGAGKSTLLLDLALYLVAQAKQDMTQLLPVLLPLSSWATHRPPLEAWLSEQVSLLYNVPRSLCQQWIQAEQFLFLLDGLDEMEASARTDCISAINSYHREHIQPFVVSSRTNEYTVASTHERLALHTAVVIQPLSPKSANAYLERKGKPLAALRSALKKNAVLAELATTPLMLQVLVLAYHGIGVRELPKKETQIRQQIWDDYIRRMINRKGDIKRYTYQCTSIWLSWLAHQMQIHNQTIFFLEQLQPDWLPPKQKRFYEWSVRLSNVLLGLFLGGLLNQVISRNLSIGILSGMVWMLLFLLIFGRDMQIKPMEAFTWSRENANIGFFLGFAVALGFKFLFGLVFRMLSPWVFFLITPVAGCMGFLFYGFSGKQLSEREHLAPNEGIRRSAIIGLLHALPAGLFWGLVSGFTIGVANGLALGLFGTIFLGLTRGLQAVLKYFILRFWLWQSHLLPWQVVPFLEDATSRILLRRIGGGYSFAHRLLQEHFANVHVEPSALSASTPNNVHSVPSPLK